MFAVIDMTELGVLLGAVFTAFVAIMGAFFKYMSAREKAASEERKTNQEMFGKALDKLSRSIDSNTQSQIVVARNSEKVAESTNKAALEAEKRNGHLAELALEGQKNAQEHQKVLLEMAQRNYEAITNVHEQHVDKQIVKSETVEHREG